MLLMAQGRFHLLALVGIGKQIADNSQEGNLILRPGFGMGDRETDMANQPLTVNHRHNRQRSRPHGLHCLALVVSFWGQLIDIVDRNYLTVMELIHPPGEGGRGNPMPGFGNGL